MFTKKYSFAAIVTATLLLVTAMPVMAEVNPANADTRITADVPNRYTLTVPESVTMRGNENSGERTAQIPVLIKGALSDEAYVSVSAQASEFTSGSLTKDVTLTVPESVIWDADSCADNGTSRDYTVSGTFSPGNWSGSVTFNCSLNGVESETNKKLGEEGNNVIPTGSAYTQNGVVTKGNGTALFPGSLAIGDVYKDDTYIYTLNQSSDGTLYWQVAVKSNSSTTYKAAYASICGKPVTNMDSTYAGCYSLTEAPAIPSGVTSMNYTFAGCSKLTKASSIPLGVTSMTGTFNSCGSLINAPVIPDGVTSLTSTFTGCTSLETVSVIPNTVTDMTAAFLGCTKLSETPNISAAAKTINAVFNGCTALTKAPVIPAGVTSMVSSFAGCSSMAGTLTCNADPTVYNMALSGTQIDSIAGSCPEATKAALLATK